MTFLNLKTPYGLGQILASLQLTHFQLPSTFCMQLGHLHLRTSSSGGFSSIACEGAIPKPRIAALTNAMTIKRMTTSI